MTTPARPEGDAAAASRRVTIRTTHDRPDLVAAALEPDNTDEMTTRVVDRPDDGTDSADGETGGKARPGTVETTIERSTTGGLRTTADDYVTNLQVAQRTNELTTQP